MIATVGLIGDPIGRSVSPAMHNAAFAFHGLADRYTLWPTSAADLAERVAVLRQPEMLGANVTIPHKTAVVSLIDSLDPVAEAVGAVNTIVRQADGSLHGLNTDVEGFLRALRSTGFEPKNKDVVMFGAGGAARGVGYGLIVSGVRSLTVINRTQSRAEGLLADLLAVTERDPDLWALGQEDAEVAGVIGRADLLINATSIGSDGQSLPLDPSLLRAHLLVVDLIYRETPLLQTAAARGAQTQDGLDMLVHQGALSFEAWTRLPAPVDVMRRAAAASLKEQL